MEETENVNPTRSIHRLFAAAALDDGRDGLDHALHRLCDDRLVDQLPCARVDPSPAGHRDSDPGRRSLHEPAVESGAALSGDDAARGAPGGNSVGILDVWFDVRSTAGRLGNVVGGALSDCPFWLRASAFYPSARCNAVFGFADGAHHPCIPFFPDVHRSLWGDLVSHADRAGRNSEADGAMEYSAIEAASTDQTG